MSLDGRPCVVKSPGLKEDLHSCTRWFEAITFYRFERMFFTCVSDVVTSVCVLGSRMRLCLCARANRQKVSRVYVCIYLCVCECLSVFILPILTDIVLCTLHVPQ